MLCFTCHNVVEKEHPNLVYIDDTIVVNHHIDGSEDSSEPRPGWFLVSPRRCVTRLHELNTDEHVALLAAVSLIDRVLTNEFGATRTLTASLGVNVSDHIHFHVVPTFDPPGTPTAKWKMFQGHKEEIYRPAPCPPQEALQILRAAFSS
jgi:diadenosine tetraphosphate (Ap4A) HIT family hydrolase